MPAELQLVYDIMPELPALLENRTRRVVQATCRAIKNEARRSIFEGPKTGKIYTSGPQPLPHQASAEGEAPANWTDKLAKSIRYKTEATGEGTAEGEVRVGEAYGDCLENGTVKMAARPFLKPAADKANPAFIAAMDQLTSAAFEAYLAQMEADAGPDEDGDEDA